MNELPRVATERLLHVGFQLAAGPALLTAEKVEQLLRSQLPAHFIGVDVRRHDAVPRKTNADELTGKHGAASGVRW
jgi:hypothetical protein